MSNMVRYGHMVTQTQWTVITGAPSSGKTTIFNVLSAQDFSTRPEPGTLYIESQLAAGRTLDDICSDQSVLQRSILEKAMTMHAETDPASPYFLDRSAVDTIAYCRLYNFDDTYFRECSSQYRFKHVFQLDRLPFSPNHVRIEDDATTALLDQYLQHAYESLGYTVIRVPVMTVEERITFILNSTR